MIPILARCPHCGNMIEVGYEREGIRIVPHPVLLREGKPIDLSTLFTGPMPEEKLCEGQGTPVNIVSDTRAEPIEEKDESFRRTQKQG